MALQERLEWFYRRHCPERLECVSEQVKAFQADPTPLLQDLSIEYGLDPMDPESLLPPYPCPYIETNTTDTDADDEEKGKGGKERERDEYEDLIFRSIEVLLSAQVHRDKGTEGTGDKGHDKKESPDGTGTPASAPTPTPTAASSNQASSPPPPPSSSSSSTSFSSSASSFLSRGKNWMMTSSTTGTGTAENVPVPTPVDAVEGTNGNCASAQYPLPSHSHSRRNYTNSSSKTEDEDSPIPSYSASQPSSRSSSIDTTAHIDAFTAAILMHEEQRLSLGLNAKATEEEDEEEMEKEKEKEEESGEEEDEESSQQRKWLTWWGQRPGGWHWRELEGAAQYELHLLRWETDLQKELGGSIKKLIQSLGTSVAQKILETTVLTALASAVLLPALLLQMTEMIDNIWVCATERADLAGKELANALVKNRLGDKGDPRPITLVGYSLGARVIFSCLKELCRLVQQAEEKRDVTRAMTSASASTSSLVPLPTGKADAVDHMDIIMGHRRPSATKPSASAAVTTAEGGTGERRMDEALGVEERQEQERVLHILRSVNGEDINGDPTRERVSLASPLQGMEADEDEAKPMTAADIITIKSMVQDVVLLGAPISTKSKHWGHVRSVVAGRLINGYSTKDLVLSVVYRYRLYTRYTRYTRYTLYTLQTLSPLYTLYTT